MRGEGFCSKSKDDGASEEHPFHCIHLRTRAGDYICCWCGDLFVGDPIGSGHHGQYRPRRERRRNT